MHIQSVITFHENTPAPSYCVVDGQWRANVLSGFVLPRMGTLFIVKEL